MPYLEYTVDPETAGPKYANAEGTLIDLNVYFPHLDATVPYTAAQSDPGWEHSEHIFNAAKAGAYGPVADYTPTI